MNILFVSDGTGVDYQCDCVFHGLNELNDVAVYTLNDYWYMYTGNDPSAIQKLYGMGFTVTNRIPLSKRKVHSVELAREKIISKFYDIIIYGSIKRCNLLLDTVLQFYPKENIIFIDGEDEDFSVRYIPRARGLVKMPKVYIKERNKAIDLSQKGFYFKRELREKDRGYFYPISFAIPYDSVLLKVAEKQIYLATIIPGKLHTYIYKNEADYYNGYQIAQFGVTTKKAGWDCMRHYEILANSCIPYFPDIEKCPSTTMANFPKKIIMETNRFYEKGNCPKMLYEYYANWLLDYTREYLTTRELAKYILSFMLK